MLAVGLSGAPRATSVPRGDPVKERERVREQQAAIASRLNVQKASLAKIDAALRALTSDLSGQEARLAEADQALADAHHRVNVADAAVTGIEANISGLETQMRQRAVVAYMNPPGVQAIDMLRATSIQAASMRQMYGEVRAASDADVADQLKAARSDLVFARRTATNARHLAVTRQAEQQARTRKVSAARAREQKFALELKRRINDSIAESVRLARTNKALSARIAFEQAALAARLAAARAAAAAAAAERANRAAAAAAAAEAARLAARQNTIRANGSEMRAQSPTPQPTLVASGGQGATSTATAAAAPSPIATVPVVTTSPAGINLATVGGITVAAQIAGQLQALLTAARGAGLNLTGGGYRSAGAQIALRQAHCGSSYYAIYLMAAGSCHPPTAPPGQSMHEVGLAIDFTNCSSHSTACWQWLSANAARFGFFNLPSEPWHWSINGR